MSATYNNCDGTQDQIDFVRLLIPDTGTGSPPQFAFTNEEIQAFYVIQMSQFQSLMFFSQNAGRNLPATPLSYLRVAALALGVLAGNAAKAGVVTRLLDVDLNPNAYKNFRDMADNYRQVDDESGAIAIVEQCTTVWAFRDRFWSQWARQSAGGIGAP